MLQLRRILFMTWLAIITPPFSLVAIVCFWLPRFWKYHIIGQWNKSVILAAKLICGISYQVEGKSNLPAPPYVVCSKHQSAWETLAFYEIFPPSSFVVKRSLLFIPFFGWGMWIAMAPIAINRKSPKAALTSVLTQGKKKIKQGFNVIIFPEGTRIETGRTGKFLPGASTLAAQANVPIVPVTLNSGSCWPPGGSGFQLSPGKVTVSIGKPISTDNRKSREVLDEAYDWIVSETNRIQG